MEIATNSDAIAEMSINQHLFNIEILLYIIVFIIFAYVLHIMFRAMFKKLIK